MRRKKRILRSSLSAEHLITGYLVLQSELGRRPKASEYTKRCHTRKVLDRVFGKPSWKKFIRVLGDNALPKKLLDAEHLIQDYIELAKAMGKKPSQFNFERRAHHTIKPLVRIFGRRAWRKFSKVANARMKKLPLSPSSS